MSFVSASFDILPDCCEGSTVPIIQNSFDNAAKWMKNDAFIIMIKSKKASLISNPSMRMNIGSDLVEGLDSVKDIQKTQSHCQYPDIGK